MYVIMHMFIEGILSTKILSQNNSKFDESWKFNLYSVCDYFIRE